VITAVRSKRTLIGIPSRLNIVLSAAERQILTGLQDLPSEAARRCADVLHDEHFRLHRGAMTVNGYRIVFGNDGFTLDGEGQNSLRSQREVVRVVRAINQITKVWDRPVFKITGFGVSSCGYTWAMRVETGYFAWDDILDTVVWDAWFRASSNGVEGHPWPHRLTHDIRHMFYPAARR
jgi:hypothetical protein